MFRFSLSRRNSFGYLPAVVALIAALHCAVQAGPPAGYYDPAAGLTGTQLKAALHNIIDDHQRFPYTSSATDTWNILAQADEDPANSANVLDVYKNRSFPKGDTDGTVPDGWNREHVWPKSYGFPDDLVCNYPYTDCHHLMACDPGYNSSRNNSPFDYAPGGTAYPVLGFPLSNYLLNGRWETWDHRKGDVARAILYMDVRYEGGNHGTTGCTEPDLRVTDDAGLITVTSGNASVGYMGILTTLLEWHLDDPVDINEQQRNDLVFSYQNNRNPFVDHPEYVCAIYGGECSGTGDTTPPAAPSGLTAVGGNGSVSLDWPDNAEPDLAGYNVYRATSGAGPFSAINGAPVSISTYTDVTVSNGTPYYYVVKAVDSSNNESAESPQASATPSGPTATLTINEAVPAPSTGFEWVEIYNGGSSTVDLTGWKLDDLLSGGSAAVNLSGSVAAGAYFVYTYSTSVLNNTGDDINLINPSGAVVDTTTYVSAPSNQSWARSVDGTGAFAWDATPSQGSSNQPVFTPAAPSGLNAVAVNSSQIDLTWTDNSSNEDNFVVARSTSPGGGYSDIATVGANVTGYSSTNLNSGTTYYFVVRAVNASGASANSNEASATTPLPPVPPAAPSALGATAISGSQVNLAWTDNSSNEDSFIVGRSTTAGGPYASIATVGANVTGYSVVGLNTGTTYYFVVRAENTAGASANSNEASATTLSPPAAPSGLSATAVSESQIDLAWTDNSGNETNFVVARSTSSGSGYADIATLGANVTGYSSTGLSAGTTYYYVVRATNSVGSSGNSNEASATTSAPSAALKINEALPAPSAGSEWVEIYNPGTTAVDLTGWKVDDIIGGGSAAVNLSGSIAAGGFHVINLSSVLNNTGDDINLISNTGAVADSTTYGSAPTDQSWARAVDGSGAFAWDTTPSSGVSNQLVSVTLDSLSAEDGWVLESGENTNVGGSINASNSTVLVGDNTSRRQYRSVLSFNTAGIPDTAVIQSAQLLVTRNSVSSNPFATLGALTVDIKSGALGAAATLAVDDFAAAAGASNVATLPQPSGNNVQVGANISSSGLGHVNKIGKTQLRVRFTNDDDNDSTADNLSLYSGNSTTAAFRPKLVVYYIP